MFKKSTPASTNYAFSQPKTAQSSSAAARRTEQETFYQPLPHPSASAPSSSPGTPKHTLSPNLGQGQGNPQAGYRHTGSNTASTDARLNNPFADPPREYATRTPSPANGNGNASASNPLLADQSPIYRADRGSGGMPAPTRSYARNGGAAAAAGMPARGESQSALLGDRQQANARRYGPTASAAPVGANAALLSSPGQSMTDKQLGGQDPNAWGAGLDGYPEADDYLHNPDPKRDRKTELGGSIFTLRGFSNIGCLVFLVICLLTLFAGYPIITFYTNHALSTNGAYNLGGINSTGQVPLISNFPSPIDADTPSSAMTRTGFDGQSYSLVFSDEFNKDGRTFYPGDDPFWTAVDLHYWPTGDFEWYDPSAITTSGGNLVITMTQEPIHDLNFKSGMLQSWNQMCFQYSVYMEVRVSLPGTPAVGGFWPGVWMMGNLGRPGYGATTDGTWPYTYDSCDLGTLKNQTNAAGTGPAAALMTSDGNTISYLPGQRMSACTCTGEDHAGPNTGVGRGVPEIDIIEAQTDLSIPRGQVSQSAQVAPFDANYWPFNTTSDVVQYDTTLTKWNSYRGGQYQQAVSSLTYVDSSVYQLTSGQYAVYGFEYYTNPNARTSGHITWVSQGAKSWTMYPSAVGPNSVTQIGQRLISEEPMAMVINFGMSNNFQTVNFDDLTWPAKMLVDYVRVYQRSDGKMGCDPADRPTADYISRHQNAYDDANLTTWAGAGYTMPKNSLIDTC